MTLVKKQWSLLTHSAPQQIQNHISRAHPSRNLACSIQVMTGLTMMMKTLSYPGQEETMTTPNIHKSPKHSYPYLETTSIGNSCKSLPSDNNVDHANETDTPTQKKSGQFHPHIYRN